MKDETKEIIEILRHVSTTELCDGIDSLRVLDYRIKRLVTEQKIVGTVFTVEVPQGVCGLVADAVKEMQAEQVLVITGQGRCDCAYWGDKSGYTAMTKQLEGVVVDGAIRDLDGCADQGIPIFARGVTPRSARKERIGQLNVPVIVGGVHIHPGDILVGDTDGVVVLSEYEAKMFLELPSRGGEYTIQAVTEEDKPYCRFQNNLFRICPEED